MATMTSLKKTGKVVCIGRNYACVILFRLTALVVTRTPFPRVRQSMAWHGMAWGVACG